MDQQNFIVVCALAFLTVFLLLIVLAVAMRLVTLLLPERGSGGADAPLIAALATSVSAISPGARVVQIEEIPCSPPSPPRPSG